MVWPTLRVARPVVVAVTVAVAATPLVVTMVRSSEDLLVPMVVFGLASGAAIGWIADDPISDLTSPCPINTPRRIAWRTCLAASVVVIAAAITLGAIVVGSDRSVHWLARLPEFAAAASSALAFGLAIRCRGDPLAGAAGVVGGLLLPVLVAALAFRWPTRLPSFTESPTHDRWWIVAAAAALVAVHAARDPARASRRPSRIEIDP